MEAPIGTATGGTASVGVGLTEGLNAPTMTEGATNFRTEFNAENIAKPDASVDSSANLASDLSKTLDTSPKTGIEEVAGLNDIGSGSLTAAETQQSQQGINEGANNIPETSTVKNAKSSDMSGGSELFDTDKGKMSGSLSKDTEQKKKDDVNKPPPASSENIAGDFNDKKTWEEQWGEKFDQTNSEGKLPREMTDKQLDTLNILKEGRAAAARGEDVNDPAVQIKIVEAANRRTQQQLASEKANLAEPSTANKLNSDPNTVNVDIRVQNLEQKAKNNTASKDELKELNHLKKDPEKQRQDLKDKVMRGEASDEEIAQLDKLNKGENKDGKMTEEEALKKETEDLGAELMMKMANGEKLDPADLKRLQELRMRADNIKNGLTPDEAKKAVQEALAKGYGKENGKIQEIQTKLRELMSMELQMATIPHTIQELRAQKRAAVSEAQAKHDAASSATGEDRIRKKQEEYMAYMKVAGIKAQISGVKHMAPRMNAHRMQLEADVRSGLGVTGPLRSFVEHAGAFGYNAAVEASISVTDRFDDD